MSTNFRNEGLIAKSRALVLGGAVLSSLALCGPAIAAPFMNINFDGDTAGSQPTLSPQGAPGDPVNQPTALGGYDNLSDPNGFGDSPPKSDEGSVIVNNASTMSKAAVLTTVPGNNNQGAIWMDTDYSDTGNNFHMSFDLAILHTGSASSVQTYKLNGLTGPDQEMIFGLNEFTGLGSSIFGFAAVPTSGGAGLFGLRNINNAEIDTFFNYTLGDTYHIDIDSDFTTGTVDAYVNGTLKLADYPMRAGLTNNNLVETFAFVNGDSVDSNSVALDNITGAVPEPASFSILGFAAGATLLRRRRATSISNH
jgi:hypothetical protein